MLLFSFKGPVACELPGEVNRIKDIIYSTIKRHEAYITSYNRMYMRTHTASDVTAMQAAFCSIATLAVNGMFASWRSCIL